MMNAIMMAELITSHLLQLARGDGPLLSSGRAKVESLNRN